jgi:hypothetical protein
VDSYGGPSSGCRCWIIHLGGIIRVGLEVRTRWAQNVGINSRGLFILEHEDRSRDVKVRKTEETVVNDSN